MKKIIGILIVLISIFSCAHMIPFKITAEQYAFKEGRLAFIPGLYSDMEYSIIDYINSKTHKIGPLSVIPFADYKSKLNPDMKVQGPYREGYRSYSTDLTLVDKDKIRKMFQKVDADYIYVLWAPGISAYTQVNRTDRGSYASTIYELTIYGMLFSRDWADSELGITDLYGAKEQGCCLFNFILGRTYKDDQADLVKDLSNQIIHKMNEVLSR